MQKQKQILPERIGRNIVKLWKMKFTIKEYKNILKETQEELKDFNMDFLTSWEQDIINS